MAKHLGPHLGVGTVLLATLDRVLEAEGANKTGPAGASGAAAGASGAAGATAGGAAGSSAAGSSAAGAGTAGTGQGTGGVAPQDAGTNNDASPAADAASEHEAEPHELRGTRNLALGQRHGQRQRCRARARRHRPDDRHADRQRLAHDRVP